MTKKTLIAFAVLFLASGCAALEPPLRPPPGASVTIEEDEPWRGVAAAEDLRAIDALPQIWAVALGDVRRAGFFRRMAAEGPLLAPASALPRAAPSPGPYACRIVRLGAQAPDVRPWSEGGQGFCYVGAEPDQLSLTIEAGPRRMGGYLWEEKDNRRLVFLGAQSPRGMPIGRYGDGRANDVAGLFERIGPFHYRLTLPSGGEHRLTVIELRPAESPEAGGFATPRPSNASGRAARTAARGHRPRVVGAGPGARA
jgi:hypothetical protein